MARSGSGSAVPGVLAEDDAFTAVPLHRNGLYEIDPTLSRAVYDYSGMQYRSINRLLRGQALGYQPTPEEQREMEGIIAGVRAAFAHALPLSRPITVHRGLGAADVTPLGPVGSQIGSVITEPAFTSASTHRASAERFAQDAMVTVRLPAGARVLAQDDSEHEILLPDRACFRVVSDAVAEGHRVTVLDYLPEAASPEPSGLPLPRHTPATSMARPGNPLVTGAAALAEAASGYAPENMWAARDDLKVLGEMPVHVADAIRILTTRLEAEYPIHPSVTEILHQLHDAIAATGALADQAAALFETVHADDLKRAEAPRVNEQLWNAR
jgi:hypothetical protein